MRTRIQDITCAGHEAVMVRMLYVFALFPALLTPWLSPFSGFACRYPGLLQF